MKNKNHLSATLSIIFSQPLRREFLLVNQDLRLALNS